MKNFITLGTYDGVHVGHRKVIQALVRESLKTGMKSLVLYFPVPPRSVISSNSETGLITLQKERQRLLKGLGVDSARPFVFTPETAAMDHRTFFREIFLKRFRMGGILVGRDFAFGRERKGDIKFLRRECRKRGIILKVLPFVLSGGHKVSSSAIRTLLKAGDIHAANRELGRHYEVSGKVIKGAGVGRLLGFPTANLDTGPEKLVPPGVFAVRVAVGDSVYNAVANAGFRPTVESLGGRLLLEVHILDFSRMIYGKNLRVEFLKRLRGERKFKGKEALQKQILKDISSARRYFSKSA